jgi:hypothetical protein
MPPGPFIRIDEVILEGDRYRVNHTISGFEPDVGASDALHLHFFLDTTEPANAGTNGDPPGDWEPDRRNADLPV